MSQIARLEGTDKSYQVAENVKRFTLRDYGFEESSPGKFRYERSLGDLYNQTHSPVLKVVVSKDFTDLKLSVTASNGLTKINLFKDPELYAEEIEDLQIVLSDMVNENILEEVNTK